MGITPFTLSPSATSLPPCIGIVISHLAPDQTYDDRVQVQLRADNWHTNFPDNHYVVAWRLDGCHEGVCMDLTLAEFRRVAFAREVWLGVGLDRYRMPVAELAKWKLLSNYYLILAKANAGVSTNFNTATSIQSGPKKETQ